MSDRIFSQTHEKDHNADDSKMDTIYRQAAIDAIQQHRENVLGSYEYDEGTAFVYAAAHNHIIDVIKRLSSAQPEDCSTCKHGHFSNRQCDYCGVRYPSHYERDENE